MNYQIKIIPRDKLFFKDARPLGSTAGGGANWPLPTLFHSAMLSAIHQNGYNDDWESEHKNITDKESRRGVNADNKRFKLGGLKTFGPFPTINDEVYFPTPSDIEASKTVMQPIDTDAKSNLPVPLQYSVGNCGAPSKDEIGEWISVSNLENYLKGGYFTTIKSSDIFTAESTPGVAINPETRANEESKFYQAEYLRLNEKNNVSMTAFAECEARKFNYK